MWPNFWRTTLPAIHLTHNKVLLCPVLLSIYVIYIVVTLSKLYNEHIYIILMLWNDLQQSSTEFGDVSCTRRKLGQSSSLFFQTKCYQEIGSLFAKRTYHMLKLHCWNGHTILIKRILKPMCDNFWPAQKEWVCHLATEVDIQI